MHRRLLSPTLPRLARHLCSTPAAASLSARRTKIVATIGPASEEKEPLEACVAAGMNVMRVNFSHATVDEFHLRRDNLRNNPAGEYVSVMLDTKGPEIRMGGLQVCKDTGDRKAKISLTAGDTLHLSTDPAYDGASDGKTLFIDYARLGEVVASGDTVLLDDGLISLRVENVVRTGGADGALIETRVLNSSEIGERKGVNLPGVKTGLPAMSEKDKQDIKFGVEHDIDMVAASFVRSAEGVHEIRDYLRECLDEAAAADPSRAQEPLPLIISKIESTEAIDELRAIVHASDGIMVARGDLGVEVPIEHVITLQKEMVDLCLSAGKPVVVATQMLESMQKNPRPTRAEVADVTNAVLDGADAVMLSGESANGKYPSESVGMQASICEHTERWADSRGLAMAADGASDGVMDMTAEADEEGDLIDEHADSLGAAAHLLAERVGASAILVYDFGDTGRLARAVSKYRPAMPIAAVSESLKICRQLSISRGVEPFHLSDELISQLDDIESSFELCQVVAANTSMLDPDDTVVCVVGESVSVETIDEHFFDFDTDGPPQ